MAYRRAGLSDSNINPTTIWTPQTGFNVSGGGGSGPAVFVAPAVIPSPACTLDTQPGGAAFSDACIAQVLANQQANMQARNNANYNVDLQNCLNTYPQPPDCYQRTFGLTPTGGYTSDAGGGPGGSQAIVNAGGQVVASPAPVSIPAPSAYVAPSTPVTPAAALPSTPATSAPSESILPSAPAAYVSPGTDFLSSDISAAGFNIPIWGLLAAGTALLLFMGGKH